MELKYLSMVFILSVLLSACGGSSNSHSTASTSSSKSSSSLMTSSESSLSLSSSVSSSSSISVGIGACAGSYILCDDFDGAVLDANKWQSGNTKIANKYPVRPENISLESYEDNGSNVSVVKAAIYGDLHAGAKRQGGLIISKNQYGGGRYEVRMKTLPGPNGCSCIWNYYDSLNENNPPATRVYTEIDIEMPAHVESAPVWSAWQKILGFNTWSHTDADQDATYISYPSTTVNPFDGNFHVFRWDWYDGNNGNLRIDWYVDNILQSTTSQHVSDHAAQLWVGNWPAPWSGMEYNFDTLFLYIDWVKISAL